MEILRIIGDVHGQIHAEDLVARKPHPYLDLISDAEYSIQLGDMGDGETYNQLTAQVDDRRHRFLPGNHDHYDQLPRHSLGDFGATSWGGVDFFFVRGAESTDRKILIDLGKRLGKTLWFAREELSDEQMQEAEQQYARSMPRIVLSHDAPTDIARLAWKHASQYHTPNPEARFHPSRTSAFLSRLLERHAPKLWVFGHHHRDWKYQDDKTLFVCVGELSCVDITSSAEVLTA
jgi:predicted phosphodiesterase